MAHMGYYFQLLVAAILGLFEISEAAELVAQSAHPDANIIYGTVIDDALGDEVRVTVIAAGFEGGQPEVT
jgi:cell division protein FtsZ